MKSMSLALALLLALHSLHAEKQEPADSNQSLSPEEIVYIPVWAISPTQNTHYLSKSNIFFALLAIAGTFGNLLFDQTTTLSVVKTITNIVKGLAYATDNTIHCNNVDNDPNIIETLINQIQHHVELLVDKEKKDAAATQECTFT